MNRTIQSLVFGSTLALGLGLVTSAHAQTPATKPAEAAQAGRRAEPARHDGRREGHLRGHEVVKPAEGTKAQPTRLMEHVRPSHGGHHGHVRQAPAAKTNR